MLEEVIKKDKIKLDDIKISIIIPIYNVESYLKQCLDSVINQTLKDFEVICINDGSTDNSLKILEDYAKQDERFKIYSQENQGQGVARNNAMKIAKGDYIVFVDPDDWIEPNMLEELQKAFEQTKTEVLHFNYCEYNDDSGELKKRSTAKLIKKHFKYDLNSVPYYNWKDVKKNCLWKELHAWARAYSREFLQRSKAVFAPTKYSEDHLFANIVLLNAEKIYYLDKYLYVYRCRNGSAVNSISDINFCIFENIELFKTYLIEHHLYDELEDEFKRYQFMVMKWHYKYIPSGSIERYKSLSRELLSEKEYKKWLWEVKHNNRSFLENIFSLKNERILGIKYKVLTVLGMSFTLNKKEGIKLIKNKKDGNIRTVSVLGFPLYVAENTDDYRVQKFLGGLIYTKRDKSKVKEIKIFKVFDITVSKRVLENDIIKYYCCNRLVNEIHPAELFYKKYLKKIKFKYDDVYIFNSNSGEVYLFLAYLAKSFLQKNQSKMPLFVATRKYHVDILKLYLPEAERIFIPDLKIKTQSSCWECCGHRFFILFSDDYFEKIEKDIKEKQIGDVHYLDCMLKTLELTEKDFVSPDAVIPFDIKGTLSKKTDKLALNSDNFVILAPEALTCEEISKDFWTELAGELAKRNVDVYLNITDKKNEIQSCKSADLSYSEIYYLAKKAKAVVSLRSGLSEFLLPTGTPNIAIYTKFRYRTSLAFSADKGITGFSMLKLPFVKKENIRELNYDKFISEKELLDRVLNELENYRVFNAEENAGCLV